VNREEKSKKTKRKKKESTIVKREQTFSPFFFKSPIPDRGRTLQAFDIQKKYFVKDASSVNLHLTDLILSYIAVIIGVVFLYEKIDMDKKKIKKIKRRKTTGLCGLPAYHFSSFHTKRHGSSL